MLNESMCFCEFTDELLMSGPRFIKPDQKKTFMFVLKVVKVETDVYNVFGRHFKLEQNRKFNSFSLYLWTKEKVYKISFQYVGDKVT